jgi:uncharacterized protein
MIRVASLILTLLFAPLNSAWASCAPDRVDLRGMFGQARFTVEIADTNETRMIGLMNRASMPRSVGMLFIYDAPTRASFWMENTLIPLDMIFVDPTGLVTRVHYNAVPLDRTPISGGENVLMVLEINGGLAQAMGIAEGAQLRHPRLDQSLAAWPCDE